MSRSVRLLVEGCVQGVGYRFFARGAARDLGLRGWVRNLPDGRVEARVVGEDPVVETFITRLRQGPRHGRVDRIHVSDETDDLPAGGFHIRD
jgi:acylphosphatase